MTAAVDNMIRIAYENPELRPQLLPIIAREMSKTAALPKNIDEIKAAWEEAKDKGGKAIKEWWNKYKIAGMSVGMMFALFATLGLDIANASSQILKVVGHG